MQKNNPIHYALLILGLSGASLTYSITPEDIAAALNVCKERFNTSDKDECRKLVLDKISANIKVSFNTMIHDNFVSPIDAQQRATIEKNSEENRSLGQHYFALGGNRYEAIKILYNGEVLFFDIPTVGIIYQNQSSTPAPSPDADLQAPTKPLAAEPTENTEIHD